MTRKTKAHTHTASHGGRPADEVHREFLAAIRAGRLTRRQFDSWHAQRRSSGRGLVITLREVHAHSRRRHH